MQWDFYFFRFFPITASLWAFRGTESEGENSPVSSSERWGMLCLTSKNWQSQTYPNSSAAQHLPYTQLFSRVSANLQGSGKRNQTRHRWALFLKPVEITRPMHIVHVQEARSGMSIETSTTHGQALKDHILGENSLSSSIFFYCRFPHDLTASQWGNVK